MYVHDEPTMEFLPKVQNLVQYIRTYSRSAATFGAFAYGWLQTPNQLSTWRDVDDVPMIDNYPIAYNLPIGGSAPTTYPTLTPEPTRFPANEGVQQSVWKLLLSVNGDPTTSPIIAGHAADWFRPAGLGRTNAGEVADVFSGREHGVAGDLRRRKCPDALVGRHSRRITTFVPAPTTAAMRSRARRSTRPQSSFRSSRSLCSTTHSSSAPTSTPYRAFRPASLATNRPRPCRRAPARPSRRESSPPMRLARCNATANRRSAAGLQQASRAARASMRCRGSQMRPRGDSAATTWAFAAQASILGHRPRYHRRNRGSSKFCRHR